MDGVPGLFGPVVGGPFGWLNAIPPLYNVVLVPALAIWLPLLRKRVVLAWGLYAVATLLFVRDAIRQSGFSANDQLIVLERAAFGATSWSWFAAIALVVVFRLRGSAGAASSWARTVVVLAVFAPVLAALVFLLLAPLAT